MSIKKQCLMAFSFTSLVSLIIGGTIFYLQSLIATAALVLAEGLLIWAMVTWTKRYFSTPLGNCMKILSEIGLGDTSGSMPMGTPVNCSKIKNCGLETCPSYGKEDHCWVNSGSFAIVKHCPKAKKGEDCRNCDIYGAHSEMEELGSIIGGMVNYFRDREQLALKVAEGDLTGELFLASDKDSLGKAFHKMKQNLTSVLTDVQSTTEEVVTGSEQLSQAAQSLSNGTSKQMSSLEEISSSMDEIAARARKNKEIAIEVQGLSSNTFTEVQNSNKQMESLLHSMEKIKETSGQVTKVIKVIEEIAFQTNLLALNAAVESARAGKYGKGFAVVADEVRKLAGRSAEAAKESEELIQQSIREVQNGVDMADKTASGIEIINSSVEQVNNRIESILSSSRDQNESINGITSSLTSLNEVVQTNSSIAEETAASAEELTNQSLYLNRHLSMFSFSQTAECRIESPSIKNKQIEFEAGKSGDIEVDVIH